VHGQASNPVLVAWPRHSAQTEAGCCAAANSQSEVTATEVCETERPRGEARSFVGKSSLDLGRRETALLLALFTEFQDTQKDLWLYVVYFSPDVNGLLVVATCEVSEQDSIAMPPGPVSSESGAPWPLYIRDRDCPWHTAETCDNRVFFTLRMSDG